MGKTRRRRERTVYRGAVGDQSVFYARWRGCLSKRAYRKRSEAEHAAERSREHTDDDVFVYRCSACNRYHLTSRSGRGAD